MEKLAKKINQKLESIDCEKASTILNRFMAITFCLIMVGSTVSPVFAGSGPSDAPGIIVETFKNLGEQFINIAYSLMVIVFAVGTVKSGLSAQVSQQFGIAGRTSAEVMNLVAGVLVFVIGMLTLPLVHWILNSLGDVIAPDLSLDDLKTFTN